LRLQPRYLASSQQQSKKYDLTKSYLYQLTKNFNRSVKPHQAQFDAHGWMAGFYLLGKLEQG
jgi:hypothetical protein